MASKNECIIEGRLGQDPKVGTTQAGRIWCHFSVAVYQGKDKNPLWMRCGCVGDVAEAIGNNYHKGMNIAVKGKLVLNEWQGKESVEMMVFEIYNDAPPVAEGEGADSFGQEVQY